MKRKYLLLIVLFILIAILFTGCVPGDGTYSIEKKAGFFWGIWHGWVAPVSLIIGIFNRNVRIYEVNNVGWWYDFGFYIAIVGGFGSLSLFRKKGSQKKRGKMDEE